MERVVVTAYGAVSAHGNNLVDIWSGLTSNISHTKPIKAETHFDSSLWEQTDGKNVIAVAQTNEELAVMAELHPKDARKRDRHQLFAEIAALETMRQARFEYLSKPERFGISVGIGGGGLEGAFEADNLLFNKKRLLPTANLKQLPNIFAGYIANRYGLRGPMHVHCTACAASAHAIMHAADLIKLGRADVMLVGGAEAAITPYGISSFEAQRALGTESLPYHKDRDGFVMGEGSAMLMLESYTHARERHARILAELVGYAATGDGSKGLAPTAPNPDGGYRSAKLALEMAGLRPEQIDYINTHGTATPTGDKTELDGIRKWADSCSKDMTVSSTKSYTGHLLGAASALEAILTIRMMLGGRILPTRGLSEENLDQLCAGFDHVMGEVREKVITHALSNSFGFGGTNATLIFSRYQ